MRWITYSLSLRLLCRILCISKYIDITMARNSFTQARIQLFWYMTDFYSVHMIVVVFQPLNTTLRRFSHTWLWRINGYCTMMIYCNNLRHLSVTKSFFHNVLICSQYPNLLLLIEDNVLSAFDFIHASQLEYDSELCSFQSMQPNR